MEFKATFLCQNVSGCAFFYPQSVAVPVGGATLYVSLSNSDDKEFAVC
jgi:hypothetical protein